VNLDLVTSSGHQLNGGISILQRSLRPEIIATFQMPEIIDMWSVCNDESEIAKKDEDKKFQDQNEQKMDQDLDDNESKDSKQEEENQNNQNEKSLPTYLFLSKLDSTVILQMGAEISELEKDKTEFCTKLPTLYCANLSKNKYILQITTNKFNLYSTVTNKNEEPKLIKEFELINYLDSRIKSASSIDSFISVLTENGTCLLFVFDEDIIDFKFLNNLNKISDNNPLLPDQTSQLLNSQINCFSLFRDSNELFLLDENVKSKNHGDLNETYLNFSRDNSMIVEENHLQKELNNSILSQNNANLSNSINVDDEDELLYGPGGITSVKMANVHNQNDINKILATESSSMSHDTDKLNETIYVKNQQESVPNQIFEKEINYLLFCVTFDGTLQIFNLEKSGINLIYTFTKFAQAPKTLIPSTKSDILKNHSKSINSDQTQPNVSSLLDNNNSYQISEILLQTYSSNRTYLMAKIDEDLIIYEAFKAVLNTISEHKPARKNLKIALSNNYQVNFKRVQHEILIRDKRSQQTRRTKTQSKRTEKDMIDDPLMNEALFSTRVKQISCLKPFDNAIGGGYSGFAVINSANSYMVFFCPRSGLTAHPFWIDGQIVAFTQFTNSSITLSGFIYMNKTNDIRVSSLPIEDGKLQINYDSSWISKKVQLRQTVNFILYHQESKTYAVVTSVNDSTNKLFHVTYGGAATAAGGAAGGGEEEKKEAHEFERDENFILPQRNHFTIQLYTANDWQPLPLGKYSLSECEHVTSFKLVNLPYEGHSSGYKSFMAASTMFCYNEDMHTRGRILIFDVIETVPEPGQPLTAIKMKPLYEKEQKGPVSCLESVNGYLVGCVGQKVFLWEYVNNELIGKAFIDANFYIHKISALKGFVLLGDLCHGTSLIRFQKEYTKLSYVAKVRIELLN
jgi:cleavage and polyadenylation specificity factor subunit 1